MNLKEITFFQYNTIIVGTGAAGLNAALALKEQGQDSVAIVTEGRFMGTSRNTGSDKQTYYKLTIGGEAPDSALKMAQTLFDGGCMDGDLALCEAAGSLRAFFRLVELGVPFPFDSCGGYVGYKTDHDPLTRGISAGPLTSKYMTECLGKAVDARHIDLYDGYQVIKLLTDQTDGEKQACGVLALNKKRCEEKQSRYAVFSARNIIWATGGEAGMYEASVYPPSQTGGMGILFREGAVGKNLTESQFGIASVKFRWNLSGTFQQCVPRYISTDADGGDETEFLKPYFDSPEKMISAIFLKGYQWPFDAQKAFDQGSSLIDLLVYQETVLLGRKVYLDYVHNPSDLEQNGNVDFSHLKGAGREYLENSGALLGTPYERLKKMNPNAIEVYAKHNIDLSKEYLEIQVCAQHNNGGISCNKWWESNIRHLFVVGEANGSHGVYRPGGTALNSGQVGGMRAAQFILHHYMDEPLDKKELFAVCEKELAGEIAFGEDALEGSTEPPVDIAEERKKLQHRMTKHGAFIRNEEGLGRAIEENQLQRKRFDAGHQVSGCRELSSLFQLRQLMISQYVYLSAMMDYSRKIGISRGSFLVYNKNGTLPEEQLKELFRTIAKDTDVSVLQEIRYLSEEETCSLSWRKVRPIPKIDNWFENVWRDFRNGDTFKEI
ncbi:MAG: FAD-binding protein [Lachnospiraceae bacterium]|nr:FAD-binding protein [Lachnospiraceae bacterium]